METGLLSAGRSVCVVSIDPHQQASPGKKRKKRRENQKDLWNSLTDKTVTKARLRVRRDGTTKQHSEWKHLLEVIPRLLPSLRLSSCQNLARAVPGGFVLSFLVLFYPCFYSPPTAEAVFYLVALIARPGSLRLLFLHTGNLSSVLLKVLFLWFSWTLS